MDEALKEILARLDAMGRGNTRMENKIDNIQREMRKLRKENEELREENRLMKDAAKGQLSRIEWLEREIRKRNVVLQGVEEEKNENEEQLMVKVKEVFNRMNLTVLKETDIMEMRRIGKEREGFKRPVLMEVRTMNMKMEILRKKNKLRGTEIYINEDYTKEVQKQRRDLVKFMRTAREQGHEATLIYNKLRINGRMYTLEQLGEDEQARKEVCEQPNMTSNSRKTVSDRSPYEEGKEEMERRTYKVMRNITNTDRRDIRGTGEND